MSLRFHEHHHRALKDLCAVQHHVERAVRGVVRERAVASYCGKPDDETVNAAIERVTTLLRLEASSHARFCGLRMNGRPETPGNMLWTWQREAWLEIAHDEDRVRGLVTTAVLKDRVSSAQRRRSR